MPDLLRLDRPRRPVRVEGPSRADGWTCPTTSPSTTVTPSATTTGSSRLRRGDKIEIGRWLAPYDLVRRYLVTGVVDAGRMRSARHGTIITAMTQLARWGPDGTPEIGDNAEWEAARDAVEVVMARYHRGRL